VTTPSDVRVATILDHSSEETVRDSAGLTGEGKEREPVERESERMRRVVGSDTAASDSGDATNVVPSVCARHARRLDRLHSPSVLSLPINAVRSLPPMALMSFNPTLPASALAAPTFLFASMATTTSFRCKSAVTG
jgi:hypothetical protein